MTEAKNPNTRLPDPDDGLVGTEEAARFLDVSRAMLFNMMSRGDLPSIKVGRHRKISRRVLREFERRAASTFAGPG